LDRASGIIGLSVGDWAYL